MNLEQVWDVMVLIGLLGVWLCAIMLPAAPATRHHAPPKPTKANWLEHVCQEVSMLAEIKEILNGLLASSGNLATVTDIGPAYSFFADGGELDVATGKHFMRAVPTGKCVYLHQPLSNKTSFRQAFDQTGYEYDLRIASDGRSFSLYPIVHQLPYVAPTPKYTTR